MFLSRAKDVANVVEHLPGKPKALDWAPSSHKTCVTVHSCNKSTW